MISKTRALLIGAVIATAISACFLLVVLLVDLMPRPELLSSSDELGVVSSGTVNEAEEPLPFVASNRKSKGLARPDKRLEESALEWDQSIGPMDILEQLTDKGVIGSSGAADWHHSWLSVCVAALRAEQARAMEPSISRVHESVALQAVCSDVLPTDFDLNHLADMHALSSTLMDLAFERALGSTAGELQSIRRNFGRSRFLDESRRLLSTSLDILELQRTIEQLYHEGEVLVPEVDMLVHYMSQSVVSDLARDIAFIWFCNRVGGCINWDHPLVLKRCFLSEFPCYGPRDMNEAIYQVTPPVVYESLRALEDRVWHFSLSQGRR